MFIWGSAPGSGRGLRSADGFLLDDEAAVVEEDAALGEDVVGSVPSADAAGLTARPSIGGDAGAAVPEGGGAVLRAGARAGGQ